MTTTPWDIRLARRLVRPLASTAVTPNHLTTLSLLAGLGACALFATGNTTAANAGALLFMLSALIDHTDGELARMTNKASRFGHYYDLISGSVVYIGLFLGIGLGLRHGPLGNWAVPLGLVAGAAVGIIMTLRFELEQQGGREAIRQPTWAGFEIEDIMYIVGPVTWLGALQPFLIAAGIGAPLFGIWFAWDYWNKSTLAKTGSGNP